MSKSANASPLKTAEGAVQDAIKAIGRTMINVSTTLIDTVSEQKYRKQNNRERVIKITRRNELVQRREAAA